MAIRPFNSINGFQVGESPKIDVIYANGDVAAVNLTSSQQANLDSLIVQTTSNLGNVGNLTILGGSPGQFLTTDGNGNLSFGVATSNSAASMPYQIDAGNSFVIPIEFQGLFAYPITIDGALEVDGLLIEVGTPINADNYQIIYDSDSTLSGNAGFNFIPSSGNLYVPGNIVPSGSIVPRANNTSSLGSPTNRFSNLYLSGNTIYLGNANITTDTGGNIVMSSYNGASMTVGGSTSVSTLSAGNSNISINVSGPLTFSSNGVANVMVITNNTVNVTGNLSATNIITNNLYYSNGTPYDFRTAAGANTQIQYSNGTDLSASANLTYNDTTQVLTVNGNIVSNNVVSAHSLVSTTGCVMVGNGVISVAGDQAGIFNSSVANITIGVGSNNVTLGSATGNVFVVNNFVSNGNITTTNTVSSNNISVGDLYSQRTPVAVPASNTIIDSFPVASFRSAKYTIKASSDLGYQALEVLLLQDNINTHITVYASLSSAAGNAETIQVTANITSGNVNLLATPYSQNCVVNLMGTYVPD